MLDANFMRQTESQARVTGKVGDFSGVQPARQIQFAQSLMYFGKRD
jgi:hypothetical protein